MGRKTEASKQFAAGGSAGLVEVVLMHPLDLVKTRFQVEEGTDASLAKTFRDIKSKEGLPGFYRGIVPPVLAETPKRATKFLAFEQYKLLLGDRGLSQPLVFGLAGLGSGMTEAAVICPFEVVKVRMQMDAAADPGKAQGTFQVARELLAKKGVRGLYTGLVPSLWRDGVWNAIYFGLYHSGRASLPAPDKDERPYANVAFRLGLGLAAGSLASAADIPLDVAKSRIQAPQGDDGRKYFTTLQTLRLVAKEEGAGALFSGLLPKILRLGPGGAIMLVVYETVLEWLD